MRLIIDLQACQNGDNATTARVVALAQALIRNAGENQVLLALSNQYPARIEMLRAKFEGLIASDQIVLCHTPAPDGSPRVQAEIEAIRNNFLAANGADIVFMPEFFGHAVDTVGTASQGSPFPTALSSYSPELLAELSLDDTKNTASRERARKGLNIADLLFISTPPEGHRVSLQSGMDTRNFNYIDTDPTTAAIQLWGAFKLAIAQHQVPARPLGRPRLAYVSLLPPASSGIANYSADLIGHLSAAYDIHLITCNAADVTPSITLHFPVHGVEWFENNAKLFERVLYHIGNSPANQFVFDLIERHPGILVLHDFFLSNALLEAEAKAPAKQAFRKALFYSHGYSALEDCLAIGDVAAAWKYPSNKRLLNQAIGVIVHSDFPRRLCDEWYGTSFAEHWREIPLLRNPPLIGLQQRAQARERLRLADDSIVICSFGVMGVTKLNHRLLEAFIGLPLQVRERCRLIFVGPTDQTNYGDELIETIAENDLSEFVQIAGIVDAATYADYLHGADIAVQLRGQTRGETSASTLDCLMYGIATIVNSSGSITTLPNSTLVKLPEQFQIQELQAALLTLCDNPKLRSELGTRGRAWVLEKHSPSRVQELYLAAIESFVARSPLAHYRTLLNKIAALGAPADPRHPELVSAARAIAANQPSTSPRQLLIDISALVQTDLKTGIQRVVRSIVRALIKEPQKDIRIEPVYGNGGNRRYRYARKFMFDLLGEKQLHLNDDPIEYRPGDIFLGLDLAAGITFQNQVELTDMRNHGVQIHFVVYDLLPLLLPNAFPAGTDVAFREYIDVITRIADGLIGISRSVADELAEWVTNHCAPRPSPLRIGYFHLGANIDASLPSKGMPPNADEVFAAINARPTILMVGTVEPRKGHTQALAAFELLWNQQVEVNLVIVGKAGWMMEAFIDLVNAHPQAKQKLFWLSDASDEMLGQLYEKSSALLAASVGEGFGLPLIEAAQHRLPVIARDLPVFREVSGEHAFYFHGASAESMADAIKQWLALARQGSAPRSDAMPWLSWADSAKQLSETVLESRWYQTLPAN